MKKKRTIIIWATLYCIEIICKDEFVIINKMSSSVMVSKPTIKIQA